MKKQVKNLLIAVLKNFSEDEIERMTECFKSGGWLGFSDAGDSADVLADLMGFLTELSNENKEIDEIPESIRLYITSFDNWDEVVNYEAGVNGLSEYEDEVIKLFE